MKEPYANELYTLRAHFSSLGCGQKKGVLKTARGLLRIQRAQQAMIGYERPVSGPRVQDQRDT
jgi:hypothetical protein